MKIERSQKWIINNGQKARLIDMSIREKPTFEAHKLFWKQSMPRIYEDMSEDEFRKKYLDYIDHLGKFNGLCKLNEVIEIIQTGIPDEIIFSKNWKGKLTFHSDIKMRLWREYKFPFIHNDYYCKMFNYGQIHVPSDDPLSVLEGAGTSIMTNRLGTYKVIFDDYEYPRRIEFTLSNGLGSTEQATFQLVGV